MSLSSNFPAIKPSLLLDFANTKQLDPRVTFARATTATYYDGVTTAKAEENLLTYSQEFDNAAWVKSNTTVTANSIAAPDSSATADTVTATASASSRKIVSSPGASVTTSYASSVYIKAGTLSKVALREGATLGNWASFDLSSGTVIANAAAVTASIVNAGNGWYRCQMINPTTGNVSIQVLLLDNAYTNTDPWSYLWTSAGTETLYVWGAQIENRNAVTAYTATTTQQITNYIPVLMTAAAGVPRFDHNPTTDESLGLLIEEQRTNLFTYSAQLDNAAWTKTNTTITADTIVAPDGTLTGDKVVENTAAGFHFVRQNISVSAAAHTISFFAKAAERSFVWATLDGGSNQGWFNLSAGTTGLNGSGSTQITSVGNGWYRCSYTATLSAGTAPCFIYLAISTSSASYTGDGFSGVFLWGAQLEAGSFATSYIPTVASTVTRNADAASMTGTNFSSWFSAGEGTMYAEARSTSLVAAGNGVFGITDGTISNRFGVYAISTNNAVSGYMTTNGTLQADMPVNNAAASGAQFRSAFAYKVNDFAFSANGAAALTDTSGTISVANQAVIGSIYITASNSLNGTIKKIAYYPLRVTNAQLQALTS